MSNLTTLVEGNVNSIFVEFNFSAEWESLARVAVFSNGDTKVSVSLESGVCAIPWEVLTATGELYISIRGLGRGGNFVICTENKLLGRVAPSLAKDDLADAEKYTPQVMDTLLADMAEMRSAGGVAGPAGKSAYELALEHGFSGTESQWLISLKGADGRDGVNGRDGADGRDGIDGIDGRNGADGKKGADGRNGTNGRDGADGYTPVKGTDYFTAEDISEIVETVIGTLPIYDGGVE